MLSPIKVRKVPSGLAVYDTALLRPVVSSDVPLVFLEVQMIRVICKISDSALSNMVDFVVMGFIARPQSEDILHRESRARGTSKVVSCL
jgi:hypothetical protein